MTAPVDQEHEQPVDRRTKEDEKKECIAFTFYILLEGHLVHALTLFNIELLKDFPGLIQS
jgi:hypothetical protein